MCIIEDRNVQDVILEYIGFCLFVLVAVVFFWYTEKVMGIEW